MAAAQDVRDTLNNLLHKVREGGRAPQQAGEYDDTCDSILGATDRLFKSMGNAGEMVKQAKILALVSRSRGCVRMREPPAMFGQRVVLSNSGTSRKISHRYFCPAEYITKKLTLKLTLP